MTRQHNSLATRRAIFADHGGEMPFWLAWVHGEIDGAVQDWVRTQARHDPALQQDLDSIEAPAARAHVARALEATGYVTPKSPGAAGARPAMVEDLDDITNLVQQGREAGRQLVPASRPPALCSAPVARTRGTATALAPGAISTDDPGFVLRQAVAQLGDDERALLFAQWQARDGCKESLARVLLPEDDQPPSRGEVSEKLWRLRRAEGQLRQALGSRRDLLWTLGPDRVWQLLAEEYLGAATNGRTSLPLPPPKPAPKKRRSAADTEVYRRVGRSLFRLLAEVEIPLPARDEAGEATRLLQHLVGREAITHFRELTCWLYETRARLDLASDPSFYPALDRLLLWLAPECFVTDGQRPRFELSFRLYLRTRLKDYCRGKNWQPGGTRYRDLETAFRALDRQRIGDIVREAVEEAARADTEAPALIGVPLAQALQWLQVAP